MKIINTGELELISIILSFPLSVAAFSKYSSSLFFDFCTIILSQYFLLLFPYCIPFFNCFCILLILSHWSKHKKITEIQERLSWDIVRSQIIIQTTICIFMCDYSFWVKRFGKNDFYGISLMDIGIGCFLYNAAFISPIINSKRNFKDSLFLLVLGFIRLAVVSVCKLEVNPREYGYHLNFYFVLAIVKLMFQVINSQYNLYVGALLLLIYECFLSFYRSNILNDERIGFLMENKEGLSSLVPFLGVFLIINHIGRLIINRKNDYQFKIRTLNIVWTGATLLYILYNVYEHPSRRLSNLGYISCFVALQTVTFALSLFFCRYFSYCLNYLELVKFCSKNMLGLFLISNLLVLAFKILLDIDNMDYLQGNLSNLAYLAINFIVLPVIAKKYKIPFFK